MLDFLIDRNIITQQGVLYVYNPDNDTASGLNWGAIRQGEILETIQPFLEEFVMYYNESDK